MADFLIANEIYASTLTTKEPERTEITARLDEGVIDTLPRKSSKTRLSEGTRQRYKSIIRDFNHFLEENGLVVSTESLMRYFDEISKKLRPATLNLHKSALLKCVKAQLGENNIVLNMAIEKIFEQIAVYKPDKSVSRAMCVTEAQIKAMVENAPSKKTALIIQFLYKTGCRVSEMINIQLSDCESMNGFFLIRLMGKGLKERRTTIPLELHREIREVYDGETWLFESRGGKPLDRMNVNHQVQKAAQRIGLENFHPHLLRHSRATDLLKNKEVTLLAVSKFLGHASVATTAEMYVHDEVDYGELFSKDSI